VTADAVGASSACVGCGKTTREESSSVSDFFGQAQHELIQDIQILFSRSFLVKKKSHYCCLAGSSRVPQFSRKKKVRGPHQSENEQVSEFHTKAHE
jgi:hypothetical protein